MPEGQLDALIGTIRRLVGLPPAGDCTDGELLGRYCADRDEAAFGALLQRHGPLVLNVCRRVLGNAHDADDAFQATFLVLARKAGAIRRGESVGSWLFGVAHRIASKARADAARRRERERQAGEPPAANPAPEAGWAELRPILDEEVSRLPAKYRAAVVLRYLQGKSHQEAAQELGWPSGSLSWRLARALDLLRDRLARRGVTLTAAALAAVITANARAAVLPDVLAADVQQAALRFASGAAAGGALSPGAMTLAQGAMQTMWISQLKMIALVGLAIGLLGASLGFAGFHFLAEPAAKPEVKGGPVVNGLQLTLSADKTDTVMKADGDNVEPVQLKFTFTNVSDKPITLDTYHLPWRIMKPTLTGPDAASIRRDKMMGGIGIGPAQAEDFPVLAPGQSWSRTLGFPKGLLDPQEGLVLVALVKPGQYRIQFSYDHPKVLNEPLAAKSWTGKLLSNEFVLTVHPAPNPELSNAVKAANLVVVGKVVGTIDNKPAAAKNKPREAHWVEVEQTLRGVDVTRDRLAVRPNGQLWEDGKSYVLCLNRQGPSGIAEAQASPLLAATPANVAAVPRDVSPKRVVWLQQLGGYGPAGAKVLSEFYVTGEGDFRYDAVAGKLPREAVGAVVERLVKSTPGAIPDDAGMTRIVWRDAAGNLQEKTFESSSDACRKLTAELLDLARKHEAKGK